MPLPQREAREFHREIGRVGVPAIVEILKSRNVKYVAQLPRDQRKDLLDELKALPDRHA
jgi:hypothetical protein